MGNRNPVQARPWRRWPTEPAQSRRRWLRRAVTGRYWPLLAGLLLALPAGAQSEPAPAPGRLALSVSGAALSGPQALAGLSVGLRLGPPPFAGWARPNELFAEYAQIGSVAAGLVGYRRLGENPLDCFGLRLEVALGIAGGQPVWKSFAGVSNQCILTPRTRVLFGLAVGSIVGRGAFVGPQLGLVWTR